MNHKFLPIWLAALGALIVACGAPSTPLVGAAPVRPPVPLTVLGPGDVFEARVFDEKELSGEYRVASNGTITFPLVGAIEVEGMTASEVSLLLQEKLKKFLRQPHVSVLVKEYNSKKIYVFGEVRKPGTFPYEQGMNIIQAITLAGGFERVANEDSTSVTRVVDGVEKRFTVSVEKIGEGEERNLELEPGDIVFVPERVF